MNVSIDFPSLASTNRPSCFLPSLHLPVQTWAIGPLRQTVMDDQDCFLPVGHTRVLDRMGRLICMHWEPVPSVYSPPVGIYGMRFRTVPCPVTATPVQMAQVIGKGGRHFVAITEQCAGVLYIYARKDTHRIEIWGTDEIGMAAADSQIRQRLAAVMTDKKMKKAV